MDARFLNPFGRTMRGAGGTDLDVRTDPMIEEPTERLRAISLALPNATEQETWGEPTYRVRGKIFAMERRGDGRTSCWCKARPGIQAALVESDPARYFIPPYVGHHGWIGVRLDVAVDWDDVADFIEESYRMTAPKRLVAQLDGRETGD
jgi:hypothetical protein